jgi:IclR family acetate operon transcriptional repressor
MDVKTAGRTVEVFETFAKAQEPLSLSEISKALNAPLSSCLYLLRALEGRGYVYSVGPRRHIYPTRKLLDCALSIAAGEPLLQQLRPILDELMDTTQETVILGKLQGTKIVYLSVHEGPQEIRYSAKAGELKPLTSSIGKALLGTLKSAQLTTLMKRLAIKDPDKLLKDMALSKRRGYFLTNPESAIEVMAISRTFRLNGDEYGIAIAGPLGRVRKNIAEHAEKLIAACREIESLATDRAAAVSAESP